MTTKSKTTAGRLALLLGGLGVHKFYLGKTGRGVVYLVFCWTFIPVVLGIIEGIKYFTMSKENFDTTYNTLAEKEGKKAEHKSSTRIEKRNEMKERYTKHYAEYKKQLGNDKIICPLCNSKNIQTGKKGFSVGGAIVGGLVLGAVGMNDMQCTCMRCGYAWKPKDDIPYGLGEQMKITTLIRNNG